MQRQAAETRIFNKTPEIGHVALEVAIIKKKKKQYERKEEDQKEESCYFFGPDYIPETF